MKIGTKSLLFGVHQVFIHFFFDLVAWIKIYGWSAKKYGYIWWKLIICICIHDWGYWGCGNMDGEGGTKHPEWAANWSLKYLDTDKIYGFGQRYDYYNLCLHHSRFYVAKCFNTRPSKLCWADKLGTALMPTWLWVFLAKLSGEISEYLSDPRYEMHGEKDPFKFFERYKNELVPKLLKENIGYE